jgi:hypothetical protein
VLLVDDDKAVRTPLATYLRKHGFLVEERTRLHRLDADLDLVADVLVADGCTAPVVGGLSGGRPFDAGILAASAQRFEPRIERDLPQVPVRILEVAGVATVERLVGRLDDARACLRSQAHRGIDLVA